jgi:type 1 fimbria pilin
MSKLFSAMLAVALAAGASSAYAAGTSTGTLKVHAQVVPTTCSINNGAQTDVPMQDATATQIQNGQAPGESFSLSIDCMGGTATVTSFELVGTAVNGNAQTFAVEPGNSGTTPDATGDVGVQIRADGAQLGTILGDLTDGQVFAPNTPLMTANATLTPGTAYKVDFKAFPVEGDASGTQINGDFATNITATMVY